MGIALHCREFHWAQRGRLRREGRKGFFLFSGSEPQLNALHSSLPELNRAGERTGKTIGLVG